MAWNQPGDNDNNNSGNNGNRPPNNPWGKKPDNQGPPDLEQALADMKDKLLGLFGAKPQKRGSGGDGSGGQSGSGMGTVLGLMGALLVVFLAIDSTHIIQPSEKGVVLRFGKFNRILDSGLTLTLPRPFESVTRVDVTSVRSFPDTVRMLTKDENLIDVSFAVQYTIENPMHFAFNLDNAEATLQQVAEATIRQVVGSRTLDEVLVGSRGEIAAEAKTLSQELMRDKYQSGILISSINMQDAGVPEAVKDAFDDAIRAREDEQRLVNEALAGKSVIVPKAEGQSSRILQDAEAYRDVLIATAKGEASRFEQLATQYRLAPEVTRKRLYLETMESIYANTPKVVIDKSPGNNQMLYLPLDRMLNRDPKAGAQ
jgi:modulator of FtsH protease HflK